MTEFRGGLDRRTLAAEVALVLMVSLGASAIRSLLRFLEAATRAESLAAQSTTLVRSFAPDRPLLDFTYQATVLLLALVPIFLVTHLLRRSGEGLRGIGLDKTQPGRDTLRGVALAGLVGGTGLLFYLAMHATGLNLRVQPTDLDGTWWSLPILIFASVTNALLEEIVVLGYLIHRLEQIGWSRTAAIGTSAVIRGAYHLYQGFGGFIGNVAMGLLFGWLYTKWRRTTPFIIAHAIIDIVAFTGYALLRTRLSWLP